MTWFTFIQLTPPKSEDSRWYSSGYAWRRRSSLLIYFIVNVVGIFSNRYAGKINTYLHNNPSVSLAAIEADFAQAHPIGKNAWVGRKWTVYVEGPKANILANGDLVWGYYFKQTGKYSVSQLRVFNMAKKMISINLSEG